MAKEKQKVNPNKDKTESAARSGFHVQFNLIGLVVFTVSLVAATGVLSYALARPVHKSIPPPASVALADARPPSDVPAWGEFTSYDIELERPEEYVAFEIADREKARPWIFDQAKPEQARELMLKCGLTQQQVEQALAPGRVSVTATNTSIQ